MKLPICKVITILVLLVSYPIAIASTEKLGAVVKESPVHLSPSYQSPIIDTLTTNNQVVIRNRERAWYQIEADNAGDGWIKMLHVKLLMAPKREGELGVQSLLSNVFAPHSKPTESTGVRGFDETDIKRAKADIEQLKQLAKYVVSEDEVTEFAFDGKLNQLAKADNQQQGGAL